MSNDVLREALERIKYKAVSLADAQVIALEALAASKPDPSGERERLIAALMQQHAKEYGEASEACTSDFSKAAALLAADKAGGEVVALHEKIRYGARTYWAEGWNSREGKQEATSSEPTKEQKAIGAFLSAMYDCKLDGKRMREAMLGVLGITGAVPDHVEFIDSLKTALPVIESMAKNSPSQWNRDVYGKASDNIRAAIDAAMLKEKKE